jgi:hypothetical protein
MACKFCGEKDKSRLGMRSRVINGEVETVEICSSCLWEKIMYNETKDGKLLSKGKPVEGRTTKNECRLYSELGKNSG